MADLDVTWANVNLHDYMHIEKITGWDDLPDVTSYDQARTRGHGDHVGDQFARSRIVTLTGSIASPASRNSLALALMAASPVSSTVTDLAVTTFGRSLTAGARMIGRSLPVDEDYAAGVVPVAFQWKCPDPLRYGAPRGSVSTGLPTTGGGLSYPLSYPLGYGTAGTPGQVVLANDGTADAPFVAQVTGPLPSGFEVSSVGGQRIRFEFPVGPGETITIDTGEGTVVTQGTADRRTYLTAADWIQVPAGGSVTLQFTSLGGAYDPAATLTVPAFRSASW